MESVIFDLGGVIYNIDFNNSIKSFQQITNVDNTSILQSPELINLFYRFENGDISDIAFREEFKQRLNVSITDRQFDECWNKTLIGVDKCKLDTVLELSNHYFVYLLSNTNAIHWKHILEYFQIHYDVEFENIFDKVYLSFELQMSKPSTDLFSYVVEDAKLKVAETLFVDDKRENVEAASALGIKTFMPLMNSDWTETLCKEYNLCR